MAGVYVIETAPEQGIAEYGYRNIKQFDLRAFYGEDIVASLWKDNEENWHWTKRLHDIGNVEDVDTTYLEDKSILGIVKEFAVIVQDWLDDEIGYLTSIKNGIDDLEVGCE